MTYCLDAIHPQITEECELLIVDNGTEKVADICAKYEGSIYCTEENTGLSYARNTAVEKARGDYILYLDDDAKAAPSFVETALQACQQDYDIFGGVYYPWYHYGKPKWFKDTYASNALPYDTPTPLKLGEYLSGGIMAYKKEVFEQIGHFHTDIGMIGTAIGYGEESELQDRARKAGIELYYIPKLQMDHLVAEYKLHTSWFLQAYWKRGVDQAKHAKGFKPWLILKAAVISLALLLMDVLRNTVKLFSDRTYYKENWTIDTLKKLYKRMGYISQLIHVKR